MCLYTNGKIKKAKKDIVCYKIMFNGRLRNTFHSIYWNTNEAWNIGSFKKGNSIIKRYDIIDEIGSGYIHSYKNESDAKKSVDEFTVCMCVIPKKTYYYEGIHSDGKYGYAAKKMKILKVVRKGTYKRS